MASCWIIMSAPRFSLRLISAKYTGTCELVMPTHTPLRTRPAIREPIPEVEVCKSSPASARIVNREKRDMRWYPILTCTAVPQSHHRQANIIESLLPYLFETGPAIMEPTTDPAARAEPMAPWVAPAGLLKKSLYCFVPIIADIDEISKPNNMPPMVATQATK